MNLKSTFSQFAFFVILNFTATQTVSSQCFQIESVLVDACGQEEGLNEMVRFKVGQTALNTTSLSVNWPNNPWQGLVKNNVTASKTAGLNADILDAGGCGQLLEPVNGVLPANANVILVTSLNMDTQLNSFGALTETIYIIYQNNPTTASGHFANSGTGNRTLTISFGSCSDTVIYNRALLVDTNGQTVAADGAIVLFSASGSPTYINNGCSAPVPPFTVDAGLNLVNACAGATISLNGTAQGHNAVRWSAASGIFSIASNLNTNYTISQTATGIIEITLTATNSCGLEITDIIRVQVTNSRIPDFPTTIELCTGSIAPVLNATSPNGISGNWTPSIINNNVGGSYRFEPNPNQCATGIVLQVNVTNSRIPDFPTTLELCTGSIAPVLNATSPNGISGNWTPSIINNNVGGSYRFEPNPNQCATGIVLQVNISNSRIPDFPTTLELCTGSIAPVLNAASPNGIVGNWTPSIINNNVGGSYRFEPNPNQCATGIVLQVNISNSRIPDFPATLELCTGSIAPVLNATSPNGIVGNWTPSVINNNVSGSYRFVPNANQCAQEVILQVSVSHFDFDIQQGCEDTTYMLRTKLNDDTLSDTFEFKWTDSNGKIIGRSQDLNISEIATDETVFPQTYTLEISENGGCSSIKKAVVAGIFCSIPKGISPNNDTKNDVFDLTGLGVQELVIFNRYGTEVYRCSNYTNQWNGTSKKGELLPVATYYYSIATYSGQNFTGWVYLNY